MKFEFESVNDITCARAISHRFTMHYERVDKVKVFTFEGKAPSRRLLREMVKQCEKLK